MANSKVEDYRTMISGLEKYISSLQEHSQALKEAVELYDKGVNDRTSGVYKAKIDKLCDQNIAPQIERVQRLKKNLEDQLEPLVIIDGIVAKEENE